MDRGLVSVIINCRNSEKYLSQCIDSVLIQTYTNYELIIVDNKSKDKTKTIIKSYNDSRIKYYYLKTKLNLGGARNFALKKSKGKYIAFIDSDDIWLDDKLEKTVNKFSKGIGLIYSDVEYFNETSSFRLYNSRKLYKGDIFNNLLYDYNLCMSSCVVDSEVISKNNLQFDENLKVCEDLDFFLKITYLSKVDYSLDVLVKYRIHNNNLTSKYHNLFFDEFELTINNLVNYFNLDKDHFVKAMDYNYIKRARYFWRNNKIKEAFSSLNMIKKLFFHRVFYTCIILIPFSLVLFLYKPFTGIKIRFNES